MIRKLKLLPILLLFFSSDAARADLFGGDVAVLMQILAESIKQYYQLKEIIGTGRDQIDLLRTINAGLDNSIGLLDSLPIKDEKLLGELREFRGAIQKVETLYGRVPRSPEEAVQLLHDQSVAESLKMVNSFKDFSDTQEKNSQVIALQARDASPKGAARMQAETSAEILRTLSQLIRLNTQMLKLQSEQLAMTNKVSKDNVSSFQKLNQDLGRGFSDFKPDMKLVTF